MVPFGPNDDANTQGDPDGDGIANLLEFALALDPLVSSQDGLPAITSVNDTIVEYEFNNAREGLLYEVQLSTDLVTWSQPPFATLTSTSATPVQIPTTEESDGRLFIRLRISE